MAVAAPKRRSSAAPAPAPSRTAPPKRRKAAPGKAAPGPSPIRRTKGAGTARAAAAAPATVPTRRTPARKAPARKAPARTPQRARPKTKRSGGQLIPIAVARSAGAVRQLPDSGLVVRMTRGRAWIAVLGVLLVGIVALNVVTLSFAASSGKIDEQIQTLEAENSGLNSKVATLYGTDKIRNEAAAAGLAMPTEVGPRVIEFSPDDIVKAAQRLSGAG
jgi:hypothetical protein